MISLACSATTDTFSQDFELACRALRQLGAAAIEVRSLWDKSILDLDDDELAEAARIARSEALPISTISPPLFRCALPEGGDIDPHFEQDALHSRWRLDDQPRLLKRCLEIAQRWEAPLLRVSSFWRAIDPRRNISRLAEELWEAIEAARPFGVHLGVENEPSGHLATAAELSTVLDGLEDPFLGVVWNPANSYAAGETPFPDGYRLLPVSRILHVHAKDGVMPTTSDRIRWQELGTGEIDWRGQLAALYADHYPGLVGLESDWGGPDGDRFEGSRICLRRLKQLIADAAALS